jgi:hypothetical protein
MQTRSATAAIWNERKIQTCKLCYTHTHTNNQISAKHYSITITTYTVYHGM